MQQAFNQGNFRDAFEGLRRLALDPQDDPGRVAGDLHKAVECLSRLGRLDETDALLEDAIKVHPQNWRLLAGAAREYQETQHFGFLVAGKFYRGYHRGGGNWVTAGERDRVRALQLMVQAMPLALKDANHAEVAAYLLALANMVSYNRNGGESWRLQALSDLSVLPDYDPRWAYGRQTRGAPVGDDGKPIFYTVPKSFQSARSDGQRWRWCLAQAGEMDPQQLDTARIRFADFLWNQFGVETLAQWGWRFGRMDTDDTKEDESGIYALHTLGEDETIARLATGVKRFKLPDEFNYIKIYQQLAQSRDRRSRPIAADALTRLAQIFENRRQYPKAADYWRRLLREFPDRPDNERKVWQDRLDQIVGNWGRFEPSQTQPAGRGATIEYRFRNGRQIEFTAHEINVPKLLDDVKAFLKSNPGEIDWRKISIGDIGYRLVTENLEQYVGRQVAQWRLTVEPREEHFDKRVTIATPLQTPGAYLLRAKMADGNESFSVVWVDDTAIVKKPLAGKTYYFVADAATGQPIARANVEFFGWRMNYEFQPPRHEVITRQFAELSDADGQVMLDPSRQPQDLQWLITARTDQGRFAYLGFSNVWYANWYDAEYKAVKVYTITDRPVYRPEQKAHYKFWVRHAQYDMGDVSEFGNRDFTVEIHNPKGEKIVSLSKRADGYGGIEGEYAVPADATLGVYGLMLADPATTPPGQTLGGGSFRVEEYKKPEYEVTVDAPTAPVMLGEKISATIHAKYYFGSPVTQARVKYTVNRTSYNQRWYPPMPWDWFYGPGYWWFGSDYLWYPGWHHWGCARPVPFWWPQAQEPPELVADQEVAIGSDGTVKVEIDTAVAKAIHPDQDQSYTITAEVIDQSRRTIVGTGTVLVARKPFAVSAWLDRGYYRTGDTIRAHFAARTLDGKPVQGRGELRLLKISYESGKPVETAVQTWPLDTNAEGTAEQPIDASQAGQYRLSYRVEGRGESKVGWVERSEPHHDKPAKPVGLAALDPPYGVAGAATKTVEGGYVFTIVGEGFDGAQFRFNHLELVPDKAQYAPGETVKLQINTDRADGTVLLFTRPANGVYLPPKVLRLRGKSTAEEIGVVQKDMPNFFVEAVTIAGGQVYTETREIVVPPEKRILSVEIRPSKDSYKPGEKAKVKIRLTDLAGRPFVGSTVVAIYDKSLEYISGGSNVPDIKEFFWKWRRWHSTQGESSLGRWFGNLTRPNAVGMADLGVFGGEVTEGRGLPRRGVMRGQLMEDTAAGEGFGGAAQAGKGGVEYAGVRMAPLGALPAAASPGAFTADLSMAKDKAMNRPGGGPPAGAPLVQPTVRTKFADTALWVGALMTEADGTAEVALDMPENLTTWRIKVWGMGNGTRVGQGFADVVTRKDLIVRLEAPRFFVQTDEVVLSAIAHNYLTTKKRVTLQLEFGGNSPLAEIVRSYSVDAVKTQLPHLLEHPAEHAVEVEPNGEARVDWRVKVLDKGQATVRVKALTDEESDAMEQKFPCYIHGMLKMDSYSGSIRPNQESGKFTVAVPEKREPKQSRLEVRWSPTLAGAMVDALPYLVDYPYGCTEQTLNRFLPTVITQKILLDMKLDLKEIEKKRTNLNAQEIGKDVERAKQWERMKKDGNLPHEPNPVFDQDKVRAMVKDGVERLTEMQCSDGGWGWFSGWGEHSDAHTTALVVHGLEIAKRNDVALVPGVLERGIEWLKRYQAEQVQLIKNAAIKDKPQDLRWKDFADNLDAFVYMVLADAGAKDAEMLDFLYRDRTHLAVYGMAMYGVALDVQGEKEKLAMVLRNIGQYVEQDDENQTAWLRLPEGIWWCWYGSEYEAQAYYLKLLARTDPNGELARRLVKYLLNNRKNATYWNSTRDTALCIEAMADFIRRSGEDRPKMTVEVRYDGKLQKAVEITPQNLFLFDNKFVLEGGAVSAGRHTVELKKTGAGPLYYNGYLTNFTLEDFIRRAGLEIKVNRKYYQLVKAGKSVAVAGSRGQVVEQKVEKYERQELPNDAELRSGDLVEIELEIDSKNDYEYLVFEDLKPSGFEPVDLRSGYTGNDLGAYVEFRDNRVVFFARTLARGKHSVAYRMRAEIPGRFSALPTRAWAMYAPVLRANSDELKIGVKD